MTAPPRDSPNGSIHAMSMIVGELKGAVQAVTRTVEHLTSNWQAQDAEAVRARDALADKFDDLKIHVTEAVGDVASNVHRVKMAVDAVQQDVAEMKNDMDEAKTAINENKPVMVGVITDVTKLKEFVASVERKELRQLGSMDIIKRIGAMGWAAICTLAAGVFGLFIYWVQKQFSG